MNKFCFCCQYQTEHQNEHDATVILELFAFATGKNRHVLITPVLKIFPVRTHLQSQLINLKGWFKNHMPELSTLTSLMLLLSRFFHFVMTGLWILIAESETKEKRSVNMDFTLLY